jgi:hypothetical protein
MDIRIPIILFKTSLGAHNFLIEISGSKWLLIPHLNFLKNKIKKALARMTRSVHCII